MAKSLPRNPDVAAQFDLLADLLEIGGEDAFRVVAYRRAANRLTATRHASRRSRSSCGS